MPRLAMAPQRSQHINDQYIMQMVLDRKNVICAIMARTMLAQCRDVMALSPGRDLNWVRSRDGNLRIRAGGATPPYREEPGVGGKEEWGFCDLIRGN